MSTSTSINTSRTTTSTLSEPSEPSPSGGEIVLETSPGDESDEGRFERYQKMIGQGSFKSVWEAFDTHEGCNVAWSIVNVRSLSKEMRTATINERKLLEAVGDKSEYLINLKKTWYNAEKQEVVFITELCSGGSLNEYLKNSGTVRLSVVKKCCKQILQGLVVLHDHGAIHRDLKAENVYVQRATGNIRIGDYGLAAYSGPEASANLGKTMTGTPCFMAPEVLTSSQTHQYNEKVDIWSFGLVVVELITSLQPYSECNNMSELLIKIQKATPPESLSDIKHELACSLINVCLQLDPTKRPSAAELLKHAFFKTTKEDSKTTTESMLLSNDDEMKDPIFTDPKLAQEYCAQLINDAKDHAKLLIEQANIKANEIILQAKKEADRSKRPSLTMDLLSANSENNVSDPSKSKGSVNTEDLLGLGGEGGGGGGGGGVEMLETVDKDTDLMSSFVGGSNNQNTGDLLGQFEQNSTESTQTKTIPDLITVHATNRTATTTTTTTTTITPSKKTRRKTKLVRLNSGIRDLAGSTSEYIEVPTTPEVGGQNSDSDSEDTENLQVVVENPEEKEDKVHNRAMTSSFDKLLHGAVTGLRVAATMSSVVRTDKDVEQIFLSYANNETKLLKKTQLRILCKEMGVSMTETEFRSFLLTFDLGLNDEEDKEGKEVSLENFVEWWKKQNVCSRGNSKVERRGSSLPRTQLRQELKDKYHRVGSGSIAPDLLLPEKVHVKKITMKDHSSVPPLPSVKECTTDGTVLLTEEGSEL